jgi:hypothetical protein
MRRPSRFKKTDVTRATRAVIAAGLDVTRVDFQKDGGFAIITGKPGEDSNHEATNPWDEVLTNAADKDRTA